MIKQKSFSGAKYIQDIPLSERIGNFQGNVELATNHHLIHVINTQLHLIISACTYKLL